MKATVDQLASAGYTVERVNIDREPGKAGRYGVGSIPCFVIVQDGKEVAREVGVVTRERLETHLRPVVDRHVVGKEPTPAWRYAKPIPSAVRITCKLANGVARGSGTVVKWGGAVCILTARHVVKDAKEITIRTLTGKELRCRVIAVDAKWDCAVLSTIDEPLPPDVAMSAIEVETGTAATFREGDRLETAGYGPNDRYAVCSCTFKGYRRDNAATATDDWMELRGYVRPGDSGGGVFNAAGKLCGVIWGGERNERGEISIGVMAVQPGRIHACLNEALPGRVEVRWQQHSDNSGRLVPVVFPATRNPTPPQACEPGCDCNQTAGDQQERKYLLPGKEALSEIGGLRQEIQGIGAKLDALGQQSLPQQQAPIIIQQPTAPPPAASEPAGNKLEQKLDDFLHKLPIQGPIAKREEKQLESKPALERFFGATAAIVFLTLIGTVVVGAVVILGHKIYQKCHADLPAIQAKLATIPGIGAGLAAGIGTLDAANTTVDAKLQAALADIKTHMTGLLTPAPGQNTSTPPVSVNVTPSK